MINIEHRTLNIQRRMRSRCTLVHFTYIEEKNSIFGVVCSMLDVCLELKPIHQGMYQ